MNIREISQAFSLRDLRNAVLGLTIVFGGVALSLVTLYAHQTGDVRLAGISATISLFFVLLILIFVVPPLARNAGREASQLNLPFEFTTGGAIMLGLIVIVGFSAWNTGNNLLFLVLSFLSSAMFVGFIAGTISLKKLDVRMRFPETIYAGQETPIIVSLNNRKRLFPSYSVVADVRGKDREESIVAEDLERLVGPWLARRLARPPVVRRPLNYFIYVARNSYAETETTHTFDARGRFLIKDFELSTRFPFGFFRHRRRLPAREAELFIFPALQPLDHELENLPLDIGKLVANKRGLGQDLLSLRGYQPNDDLRRIDWKATARTRQLTVREFSAEDDNRVTVFLDTRVASGVVQQLSLRQKIEAEQNGRAPVTSEKFEAAVSIAASLLNFYTEEQAEVRLVVRDDVGEFGLGRGHLYESLKRLAIVEADVVETDLLNAPGAVDAVLDEREKGQNVFVTTLGHASLPAELGQRVNIISC